LAKEKYIKSLNRKILVGYLFVNFFLFAYFSKLIKIDFGSLKSSFDNLLDPKLLPFVMLYAFSIVLEGIISSEIKAHIIFFRIKNPLPGTRAFSEIAEKDLRINIESLKKLFSGKLPQKPAEQNKVWYNLFRKYSSSQIVFEAHRSFLLTRDLASLTILLIPISISCHFVLHSPIKAILLHTLILLILLTASILSCRNYGNRFVANVLVEAIQQESNQQTG